MQRLVPILIVTVALVAAGGLWTVLQRRADSTRFAAGLVFLADACDLSPGVAQSLGGPLTREECGAIERIARAEVVAAFSGLRIDFNANASAFWTVHVGAFVPARTRWSGTGATRRGATCARGSTSFGFNRAWRR